MKISERDKKLLLMFAGIVLLALSYFLVYTPQMDEADSIEAENTVLRNRLNELMEMEENRDFYEEEIRRMDAEISNYCQTFPADIREEDGILLAGSMEKKIDMRISNAGLGKKEFIASLDGSVESAPEVEKRQNLSAKGAQKTQDQLNELEGTDEEAVVGSVDNLGNPEKELQEFIRDAKWNPTLYRTRDTFQFVTDYKGLKRAVNYLHSQTGRITVDSVSASFDSSTGMLSGNMGINLYSMSNAGAVYEEPEAGHVKLGTKNIFGTIEKKPKKKKK